MKLIEVKNPKPTFIVEMTKEDLLNLQNLLGLVSISRWSQQGDKIYNELCKILNANPQN
jgi:hypothetical protein